MEGKVRRDSVVVVCPLDNLMSSHSHSLMIKGISTSSGNFIGGTTCVTQTMHNMMLNMMWDRQNDTKRGISFRICSRPEAIVSSKNIELYCKHSFFQSKVVPCIVNEVIVLKIGEYKNKQKNNFNLALYCWHMHRFISFRSMWKGGRAARMATATHREQHAFCRLLTLLLHIQCQLW